MPESNNINKLVDILVKRKNITPKIGASLKRDFKNRTNKPFESFLIDQGLVSKSDMLMALSLYYQVPLVDVRGMFIDHNLLTKFPATLMKREAFIPLEKDGDTLIIAANNPNNPELPDIIGDYVSYNVTFMVGIRRDILNAIEEFYQLAPTEVDLDYDYDDRNRSDFEKDSIINVGLEHDPHD